MKEIEQTGAFLGMTQGMGIPAETAADKIRATRRGWLLAAVGALMFLGAFGSVIGLTVFTKAAPSTSLLIFAGLLAVPGMLFVLMGGHLIAGDAMRAAEQSGGFMAKTAAKALNLARPKS